MVGDLLLVSRLESSALRPARQATLVGALLEQVAGGAALRAIERQVAISVAAPAELTVRLDGDLIRRLLDNLVGDALRSVNRGGRVELAAALEGATLVLAVRRTGTAVPEDVRPRLFERHPQVADRHLQIAGLGLYLCRLVAEAHGGRMAVVETAAWPVSFEARLPVAG
jgi:signal transduction histidine kinase